MQGGKAQDPVLTMQKTGWTNHSFFHGLEKGFTYDMDVITGEQPAIIWPGLKSAPRPPPRRKVLISALFT